MTGQLPRASNTAAPPIPTGTPVDGRWRVLRALDGAPGSELYEVLEEGDHTARLLKIYPAADGGPPHAWTHFEHECARAAPLLGNQAPRIFALGIEQVTKRPYVVTERLTHPDLGTRVRERGPLEHGEFARVLARLAPLLDRLHGAALAHGNLKPTNLFVGPELEVAVSDCGAGSLAHSGLSATPGWCAPELLAPAAMATPAADLYALGLLTFFALTGHPAFPASMNDPSELRELQQAGLRGPSARAATLGKMLDRRLDGWFWRALDPHPERRFASASEMVRAFGDQLGLELSIEAPHPVPPGSRTDDAKPKHPAAAEAPPPSGLLPLSSHDPGIVAVSVKPLLFAGDLEDLRAPSSSPAAPPTAGAQDGAPPLAPVQPAAQRLAQPESEPEPKLEPVTPDETPSTAPAPAPDMPAVGAAPSAHAARPWQSPSMRVLRLPLGVRWAVALGLPLLGVGLTARALLQREASSPASLAALPKGSEPNLLPSASSQPTTPPSESTTDSPHPTSKDALGTPTAGSEPAPPNTDPLVPNATPPSSATAPDGPADSAEAAHATVRFTCAPVPCQSVFCNAKRYDAGSVELSAGRYTCKGAARGFGTKPVTLELQSGQELEHRFEMVARQ